MSLASGLFGFKLLNANDGWVFGRDSGTPFVWKRERGERGGGERGEREKEKLSGDQRWKLLSPRQEKNKNH